MSGVAGRSGDKPKREKYATLYKSTEKQLHALLPEVAPALRELVVGIWIQETDSHGGERVYQQVPNVKAIELLLNRTVGQVTKQVEVTGKDGGPIALTWSDESQA